jgi:hypothetical protein
MPDPRIVLLLDAADEAFSGKSWHGPHLLATVRRVRAKEAEWRPAPGRHNIWELTVHAAYWKYAAWRQLTGAPRGSFALDGSNWFACPSPLGERAWKQAVALLVNEHRRLRAAIAALPASSLGKRPRGSTFTTARIVRGVVAHDLYHAGQIQLLKKLASEGLVEKKRFGRFMARTRKSLKPGGFGPI